MKQVLLNFLFAALALLLPSCENRGSEKSDAATRNSGSSQSRSKSTFTNRFISLKHVNPTQGAAALSESLKGNRQDLTIAPDDRMNRIFLQGEAPLVEQGVAFLVDLDKE